MKTIKTFRITPDNEKKLKKLCKVAELSEGWVLNQALQIYLGNVKRWDRPFFNDSIKTELPH